jgi:hypothetical protein
MLNVVTGLMMLAGAVVREQGQSFDDVAFRREVEVRGAASETQTNGARVTVVAGPPIGTMTMSGIEGEPMSTSGQGDGDDDAQTGVVAPGDWDVACTRKRGTSLVFDRESVRALGSGTLFRWAAPTGPMPEVADPIYTGVADCRAKSIEASWPGKRTPTRPGTCGRLLVDAVCAAR